MNTYQRKQLSRLIFPMIIIIAMIVLIIMAKRRDAKTAADLLAAANESSAAAAAAAESSAAESSTAAEDEDAIPTDGDAVSADELENAATCFDGAVSVTFVSFDEEGSKMTIRIDNTMTDDIQTKGHPQTVVDGEAVLLNPLGINQKLNYTDIAAGTYHLITYKVDSRCFDCSSLVLTGTLRIRDEAGNETCSDYELTIK